MLFNIEKASKCLGVREDYLRKLLRGKKLPGKKIDGKWMIKEIDVDTYLNKHTAPKGYVTAINAANKISVTQNAILNTIKAGRLSAEKEIT